MASDGNNVRGPRSFNLIGKEMSYPDRSTIVGDFTIDHGDMILSAVAAPTTAPTAVDSGIAGTPNGTYAYMCTFVTADGETEGRVASSNVTVASKQINLSAIPVSADPRVTARRIYRKPTAFSADVVPMKFLVEIADNTTTTYVDNIADAALGALINRINETGGSIFFGADRVFHADTTNLTIGWDSGFGDGYAATALGIHSLTVNQGKRNTGVGMYALNLNTTGDNNTAVGVHALGENTTGIDNTAMGYTALENNTTGPGNIAIGNFALRANTTTGGGTAIGYNALAAATGGNGTAVGYQALMNQIAGIRNVAVGYKSGLLIVAGTNATGNSNCTFIGEQTKPLNSTDTNSIVIGSVAEGDGSNTVVIGNTSIMSNRFHGVIALDKTLTAGGTTGAQTINKPMGSVNFAGAATSLVVTNSLVTTSSVIQATLGTNDATAVLGGCVTASGSFTIFMKTAPTAETKVFFNVFN